MHALVLGCGVSGLSCGVRLLQAGFDVEIWTRDLPPQTTSNVAAAVWYPYKAYPEQLVGRWARATYLEFLRLADAPKAGVTLREGVEFFAAPVADPWWREALPLPGFRRATPTELPAGYLDGYVFQAPVIEMPIYLAYLQTWLTGLGGRIRTRTVTTLDEAFAQHDLVVNCCGLGARELVGDTSLHAIRGQVVRVAQVGFDRFLLDDYGPNAVAYIIPRSHDCILGGTAEDGCEDLVPNAATAQSIIDRCAALDSRVRQAAILSHHVGLRPGRPTVRLTIERPAPGKLLAHNYGHGGAGVTLSWGCADDVVRLITA